jgi:hemerythrin
MFTWDDKHKIGNEFIDLQHELFFSLASRFQKAVQNREPLTLQVMIAREILEYSTFHFASEESLMAEHDYPGLKHHKAIHDGFLAGLNTRVLNLSTGVEKPEAFVESLFEWIVLHQFLEDLDFAQYLAARN